MKQTSDGTTFMVLVQDINQNSCTVSTHSLWSLSNDDGNDNVTENISLFHLWYFAIVSTRSTFAKIANYPGTKLVGVAYKLRKKILRRAFTFSTKP